MFKTLQRGVPKYPNFEAESARSSRLISID